MERVGAPFYDTDNRRAVNSTPVLDISEQVHNYGSVKGFQILGKRFYLKEEYKNPFTNSVKGRAVASMVLSGLRSGEVYGPGGVRKRWIEPTSGNTGKGLAEIAKLLEIEFTAVFSRLGVSQRIKTDLASNGARTITIGNEYTFADLESLGRKYKKPIHYYWSMPEPLGTKLQSFIRSQVMEVRRQIYSATPEEAAPDLHLTSIDQDYLTARVLPAAKEASISPIIMKTRTPQSAAYQN